MRIAGASSAGPGRSPTSSTDQHGTVRRRLARSELRGLKPEAMRRIRQPLRPHRQRAGPVSGVRTLVERLLLPEREEIVAIIENLFVGNKLEQGKFASRGLPGRSAADSQPARHLCLLRRQHHTAPSSAEVDLVVYAETEASSGQASGLFILTNPHVGHLGSSCRPRSPAEHRAILESLGEIDGPEPGLYEMRIDNPRRPRLRARPVRRAFRAAGWRIFASTTRARRSSASAPSRVQ